MKIMNLPTNLACYVCECVFSKTRSPLVLKYDSDGDIQLLALRENMGLYDNYIAEPSLKCPVCNHLLSGWQGKDGPCGVYIWKQGHSIPSVYEGCDDNMDDLKSVILPDRFIIYTFCDCNLYIEAVGTVENGTWIKTELISDHNGNSG
jgi:hypothetical protein